MRMIKFPVVKKDLRIRAARREVSLIAG